ncbi:MAG TPA: response regulator [Candidatus Acidoferrum sp.]|nr:response regulator [Candidatus Acidoferrum sp.]
MAKILVADDNSNIQKMVGLALKDQGIDVVAVGNGEAAVRKISDVRPDLVLADVFMPVRNGYEVCQFVKADSALSHIPVILLVGAFDPLDEQEAQRVGADGVLKKPFVPPDPLISMVKSALSRAGVSAEPAKEEPPPRTAEMLTPRPQPSMSSMPALPEFPSESELMPGPPAEPEPVRIDGGSQPLAFGSLLETPAEEEEDLATTARPQLEHDWNAPEEKEEVEEEEEEGSSSWRRDAANESLEAEEEPARGAKDWRETAFGDAAPRRTSRQAWTPQKEISSLEEAAETEEKVTAYATEAPVAETKVTPAPVTPFSADAWSAALQGKTTATIETPPANEEPATEVQKKESAATNADVTPEPVGPAERSWYSAVSSPWDAEAQKASKLASTWDAPPEQKPVEEEVSQTAAPVADQDPGATVDVLPAGLSEDVKAKVEEALPAEAVQEIREETHNVAETALESAQTGKNETKAPEPQMEDLVAKVLAKMSPDVLQAVTREILKPVVEAMVRDELNAKK